MAALPAQSLPDWDHDEIYAEAVCNIDDVFYHGCEDEDYDNPATRRLRYEAAGRRFLDGDVPFLLSASLRGPFDQGSGWSNPWRSKQRAHSEKPLAAESITEGALATNEQVLEETELGESDLECHLPSPESLKQAPLTEKHSHLDDHVLSMIQDWRTGIKIPSPSRDSFWAASKAQITASARKRRARESEWLKRVASKKRKLESSEPSFSKSPLARRNSNSRVLRDKDHLTSTNSVSWLANSVFNSRASKSGQATGSFEEVDETEDELMTSMPPLSFAKHKRRVPKTPKRVSPRRDMWKCVMQSTGQADDELSQNEAAAATLSSPISQRHGAVASGRRATDVNRRAAGASLTVEHPSTTKHGIMVGNQGPVYHMNNPEEGDSAEEALHAPIAPDSVAQLETQMDSSSCFKIRQQPDQTGKESSMVDMNRPDLETTDHECTLSKQTEDHDSEKSVEGEINAAPVGPPESKERKEISCGDDARSITEAYSKATRDIDRAPQDQVSDRAATSGRPADDADGAYSTDDEEQVGIAPPGDGTDIHERSRFRRLISLEKRPDKKGGGNVKRLVTHTHAHESSADIDAVSTTNDRIGRNVTQAPDIEIAARPKPEASGSEEARTSLEEPDVSASEPAIDYKPLAAEILGSKGCETKPPYPERPILSVVRSPEISLPPLGKVVPDPGLEAGMGPEKHCGASMGQSRPALPSKSSEVSLKSILHRLVPSSPWARLSQKTSCSEAKSDDATANLKSLTPSTETASESDVAGTEVMDEDESSSHQEHIDASRPESEAAVPMIANIDNSTYQQEETAVTPEKATGAVITESQQTPWDKTQLFGRSKDISTGNHGESTGRFSDEKCLNSGESQLVIPADAQSPWAGGIGDTLAYGGNVSSNCLVSQGSIKTPASQPAVRLSTPEPQFTVKSFASFMTPSPARTRPRTGHIGQSIEGYRMASALKIHGSVPRASRRVSWRLPDHGAGQEQVRGLQDSCGQSSFEQRGRAASPPPATPIGNLPTSESDKFRKHFAAVASRTDGLRQKLIPTASQQAAQSPGMQGMAAQFLAADDAVATEQLGGAALELETDVVRERQERVARESQEPMDVVEDLLCEMDDLLQVWDVDAELDQACKIPRSGVQRMEMNIGSQSPW
ncbi:hypothetical protein JDV02_010404 [Purpureocillium takamizusanense]|uniref:Protamine P1 n=1 Tax=Purpureocillium takamizusanense TaxID=2060973 RepID=A0A9Q8QTZ2_9HYPO|nr:uncharacterized protein JDV02_010404 [Purpureocillium takamizusanense]UNI24674.1 hypothetical protein JDV02_010404 [Purpureocillium takamizusanense]